MSEDDDRLRLAHATARRFLSFRPRTEAELRRRLSRSFPQDVVDPVVASLRERSMLDDPAFARAWVDSRSAFRPRGTMALRRELAAKGVEGSVVEDALASVDDEANAYRAAQKGARALAGTDLPTFQRRLMAYLLRRGFGPSLSRRAVGRAWDEAARPRAGGPAYGGPRPFDAPTEPTASDDRPIDDAERWRTP